MLKENQTLNLRTYSSTFFNNFNHSKFLLFHNERSLHTFRFLCLWLLYMIVCIAFQKQLKFHYQNEQNLLDRVDITSKNFRLTQVRVVLSLRVSLNAKSYKFAILSLVCYSRNSIWEIKDEKKNIRCLACESSIGIFSKSTNLNAELYSGRIKQHGGSYLWSHYLMTAWRQTEQEPVSQKRKDDKIHHTPSTFKTEHSQIIFSFL